MRFRDALVFVLLPGQDQEVRKDNGSAKRTVRAAVMERHEARETGTHCVGQRIIAIVQVLPFARALL